MKKPWKTWFGQEKQPPVVAAPVVAPPLAPPVPTAPTIPDADVIITPNEINDRHGTGVILHRLFAHAPKIISIRSESHYGREHHLGAIQLEFTHTGLSRRDSFARVLENMKGSVPRRILCVPYFPHELITAIALKEIFAVPLCIYVMDDNNICNQRIPDALMREALQKADLRLAISPEMRDEYEKKYSLKFWIMPPVVAGNIVQSEAKLPPSVSLETKKGILVGSLWSNQWLEMLRASLREAGLTVDWYGNSGAYWIKGTKEELARDGIIDRGFLPEAQLTALVRDCAFAIVPTGTLDAQDERPEIARLSLPTRMPYLLAGSNTPIIVIGNSQAAAAGFVQRLKVGLVVNYDGAALRQTVEQICQPDQQMCFRQNAARNAHWFSAERLADWIWASLERGEVLDERFEQLMPRDPGAVVSYLEAPAPKDVWGEFTLVYQAFRRLKKLGFQPDFTVDIGSSIGVWSDTVKRVFPQCRFILVDPLQSKYGGPEGWYFKKNPDFECVAAAISDASGEAQFQVSGDLFGSSLLHVADYRSYESIQVPVMTLDGLAKEKKIAGRGILKIDVQCAEHLIMAGGQEFLKSVDAIMLELSLVQFAPEAKIFDVMLDLLSESGFRYYDEAGCWRCPTTGALLQKDVLFVRKNLFLYQTSATADRLAQA